MWFAYLAATTLTTGTLVVRLILEADFGNDPALVLFLIPISLSAYLGGLGPGLVATAIGCLGASYYLPPSDSFRIASPLHNVQWATLLAVGAFVSITTELLHRSRRRAEASDRLRAVTLASIADGVVATDVQGRVTFLNAAATTLTGWTTQEAQGRPVESIVRLVDGSTGQQIANWANPVLASRATQHLTPHVLMVARDGRRIPVGDSGAPITHPDGTVHGMVLVLRDRSQEYASEAVLREKLALQERLAGIAGVAPGAILHFPNLPAL